ncbi:MAG: leucine-rich repeat protein [Acutalibacteraceae bacterium]
MKKLIAALLAAVMVFGVIPKSGIDFSTRANALTEGDFEYSVAYGEATITNCTLTGTALNIPSTLGGYPVTGIGKEAFKNCTSVTEISIPESVTSIGEEAFSKTAYYNNWSNWTNKALYIDNCLIRAENIGGDYSVLEGTRLIADRAFYGCKYMRNAYIPPSVANIGIGAFYNCNNLETVNLPPGLTFISEEMFRNCGALQSIHIPASVVGIGTDALYKCGSLTSITVDAANEYYSSDEDGVLYNKDKTVLIKYPVGNTRTAYQVPAGVITVFNEAFSSCNKLTAVTFEAGSQLTQIGHYAFNYCEYLISISLPASLVYIGVRAFYGCDSLKTVTFEEGSQLTTIMFSAFEYCISFNNIIIPESVTHIGYNAFYNTACYKNASNWVNNVLYIDNCLICAKDYVSGNCTVLDGTRFIAEYAFYDCTYLTGIDLPAGVTIIDSYAFNGCSSLTSINIPASVTSIGDYAFDYCTALTDITVDIASEHYSSDEYNVLFNKDKTVLVQYPQGNARTTYQIPAGVTTIGLCAFSPCAFLENVNIPASVTIIGEYSFFDSGSLTTVTFEEGSLLTSIKKYAFSYCSSLININLPARLESIDNLVFYDCDSLTSVTFEEGSQLAILGGGVFLDCTSLTSFNIPASVTNIGVRVLDGCTSLTSITVDSANEYYSNDKNGVLFNKDKTVLIQYPIGNAGAMYQVPGSVTDIGVYAFGGCVNLSGVTVPPGVTSFGTGAFSNCANLTIYGLPGSEAETHAADNNTPFIPLCLMSASNSECVVEWGSNIICGLTPGIVSLEDCAQAAPGHNMEYVPAAGGFGTGTVVNVMNNDEVVESYTIVIYGDVNGDGNIDAMDTGCIIDYENSLITWDPVADAAVLRAADLNGDGNIDAVDAAIAVDAENYRLTIDQTTGTTLPF